MPNPVFDYFIVGKHVLSNGDLTATAIVSGFNPVESQSHVMTPTEKVYFEIAWDVSGNTNNFVGITQNQLNAGQYPGIDSSHGWSYFGVSGVKYPGNIAYGDTWTAGDIIGVLMYEGDIYFSKNGVWQGAADGGSPVGKAAAFTGMVDDVYPAIATHGDTSACTGRFIAADIPDSSHVPGDVQIGLIAGVTSFYAELEQLYAFSDPIYAELNQIYTLWGDPVVTTLLQQWGFPRAISLVQPYTDVADTYVMLDQWYRDAPELYATLKQPYSDASFITVPLEQSYKGPTLLWAGLEQQYTLFKEPIVVFLEQKYSLKEYNEFISMLSQPYALLQDTAVEAPTSETTINGVSVSPEQESFTFDFDQYVGVCNLTMATESEWRNLMYLDEIQLVVGGTTYNFLLTDLLMDRTAVSSGYTVEGRSKAVLLDFPYASEIEDDTLVYGTASEIVSRLAALKGQTVIWEMNSDPVQSETTYQVAGKSPLGAIRDLVRELRGRLQSDPDGQLRAVPLYIIDTNVYSSSSVDYEITSVEDMLSLSTDSDKRYGYNKYIVGEDTTADGYTLEQEEVTPGQYKIKAFKTPWTSLVPSLRTSELTNVSIVPRGWIIEQLEPEIVEIVGGEGKASKNIYSIDAIDYSSRIDLGNITFKEDGTITATNKAETLVVVTYSTIYWLWDVYGTDPEEVQFILETE